MFKIFAVLMSLQLILAPVALAQGAGDQFRDGPAKNGGVDLYAKQIVGLATSAIGSNILTTCKLGKMLPSLMIFMGGSLVHIASEVMGGKAQNENHKKRASSLKMLEEKMKQTPGGDLQRASLEEALKEEKETLAFINKRKMWVMAVTAAYLAATVATFVEKVNPTSPKYAGCVKHDPSMGKFTAMAISFAYNFVAGKVGGGGAISTYGGLLLSLAPMISGLESIVAKSYNTTTGRAITFGASTVLMGLITNGLAERASETKKNIKKLEEALANFKDATDTNSGIVTDTTSGANGGELAMLDPSSNKNYAINQLPDGTTLPQECWSSTGQGMEYSSGACKAPVQLPSIGISGNLNVPTLQAAAGLTNDLARQVASGNIGAAEASAAQLGAMAGQLKQIRDNMEKQMNDKLIAQGEKPVDLQAESEKLASQMLADFDSIAGTNAGLAGMDLGTTGSEATELSDKEDKNDSAAITTAAVDTSIDVPSASGNFFNEGLTNETSVSEVVAQDAPVEYEYDEKDVSERQDVSLWQQVSNRYLFQYNKLFEREKPKLEPVK